MENEQNTFPLRPFSQISDSATYDIGREDVIEAAPPSPLIQQAPSSESENDAFLGRSSSVSVSDVNQKALDEANEKPPPSTRLHRSSYVLVLVMLYAGLALFAWTVTCILTYRPITAHHYGEWIWNKDNNGYGWVGASYINGLFIKNERWFRTARVMESIVSVLTIPLTSAVCSSAAVIFVQHNRKSFRLSIRQIMVLADKGWSDPAAYARTITSWKRYGSSFLVIAMLLNILGGIISPIQELYLSTKTIKTPTWPQMVNNLLDFPDQWAAVNESYGTNDNNLVVALTRNALLTASNTEPQAQLWQGAGYTCNVLDIEAEEKNKTSDGSVPFTCGHGNNFGNMTLLIDPFLAELPQGYSTGLIRQFIPRINSTAKYEIISETDYPAGCDSLPGAFFVEYSNMTNFNLSGGYTEAWGIQACMPANLTHSPWKSSRDRQDFFEVLYLNITNNNTGYEISPTPSGGSLFRVIVNTTAGYFELPNYMNDGLAGPLLNKDPNSLCGSDCEVEGIQDIYDHNFPNNTRRQLVSNEPDSSRTLEGVYNKGPLLTIAMALFGSNSFLANRIAYPQAYYGLNVTNTDGNYEYPVNAGNCIDFAPMGWLFADFIGQHVVDSSIDTCISNTAGGPGGRDLEAYMAEWINNFRLDTDTLTNAFNAAAFIANQEWLMNNVVTGQRSLTVTYDLGGDTDVPTISKRGIILISVLLGLDLLALFALAIYASVFPRWTNQLDSFTMMRLGAAMTDKVPLMVGRRTDQIKVLDEIPGWIGDTAEVDEEIGQLGLGAPNMVRSKRRYRCYDGDKEPLSYKENKAWKERLKDMREQGVTGAGVQALDAVGLRV